MPFLFLDKLFFSAARGYAGDNPRLVDAHGCEEEEVGLPMHVCGAIGGED